MPTVNTIYSMYFIGKGKYLTLDLVIYLDNLDECEVEFYNYLKISLQSKHELEQ